MSYDNKYAGYEEISKAILDQFECYIEKKKPALLHDFYDWTKLSMDSTL